MRKAFLMIAMLVSLAVSAQRVEKVGTAELGKPYAEALEAIKAEFGEPVSVSEDQVVYSRKNFRGFTYDEVKFRFRDGKFNEARFFVKVGSKAAAQKRMEDIARELKSSYDITRDVEDDMSWFYKGGSSPVGVSHLFTIYTYPRQGSYGTELRFGPVRF